ncbi:hypothetical protein Tco_0118020 [Tanacetum coccineum]
MEALKFVDSHNMVAYLDKSTENADFDEIVDFLNANPIRYALTVSPTIYVSYIEQFWSTAKTKTVNNETQIRAKVDGKTIVITESFVRRDLHFNDEDGIACLTNTKIFKNLQLMGYENLSDKLTFYKSYFSPQWKYLIHTILQCLSSKSTAWNEFGTNIASAVICLAKKQKFNFSKLIFDAVFNDEYDTPSHTKKVFANMRRQGKYFSGTVTPLFATMLIQSQVVESEADETVHEERGDSMERASTTAISLDAEQGSGNIIRTQSMATLKEPIPQGIGSGSGPRRQDTILGDRPAQTRFERLSKQSNDPPLSRVNTLRSGEDNMKLNELMEICTKLSERVLALENIKTDQDLEITNLKKRVKKLEKKRRLFKVMIESSAEKSLEDAETHGRYGHDTEINTSSTSITTASINITTVEPVITASAPIATAGVSVSTAEPSTPPPTTTTFIEDEDLIIAQTLMKMRSVKSKEKLKEKGVSSETATRLTRGVIMKEAIPPQQQLDPKDKGKGIMQEPEKPVKVKGKDQIKYDADMAKRLQVELDEEVRLKREREEEASNAALIEE